MLISGTIKKKMAEPYKLPLHTSNVHFFYLLVKVWLRHAIITVGGYDLLTRLAAKYQTDKGKTIYPFHGYTKQYHKLFENFREARINILEIGLARTSFRKGTTHDCPSLRLWLDYFPNAQAFGFDIDNFTDIELPRTKIFMGDQGNPEDLLQIVQACSSFDVIIDDGSHASRHQQISLKTLFPYLVSGGLYIIEDLHKQPEQLERLYPEEYKTSELVKDRDRLNEFITGVSSVAYFDKKTLGSEGEMVVIRKD